MLFYLQSCLCAGIGGRVHSGHRGDLFYDKEKTSFPFLLLLLLLLLLLVLLIVMVIGFYLCLLGLF